jgi:co-chaperonin GroES (HSP10)
VAVLIKLYEPERKGSQIVLPESVQGRLSMVDNRAVVVAIGPNAWHDEPSPRAAVGEKVLVTKFAGFISQSKPAPFQVPDSPRRKAESRGFVRTSRTSSSLYWSMRFLRSAARFFVAAMARF